MSKYIPINLPYDALSIMKFDEEKMAYLKMKIDEAFKNGSLKTNQPIEFDPTNLDNLAYWVAKTMMPVEKPEIGTGIEAWFKPYKKSKFGFDIDDLQIDRTVSFSAVGDLMAAKGLELSKEKLYEGVSDLIFNADIIHGNLESTLTKNVIEEVAFNQDETPKINMSNIQYETVLSHNHRKFDVMTLANNHILDCGEEGIKTTLERLDSDKIFAVGVNRNQHEQHKPQITELAGVKIGWVAHTWSVNFKPFPKDKPWIVNMTPFHQIKDLDISHILDQIKACRDKGCDLVVASMHWGVEHELYPRAEQLKWARQMVESGVDAIIGHHPHVPQCYEMLNPEYDRHKYVPVIYSLGNLTPVVSHPAMVLSLVLQMDIVQGVKNGKKITRISNVNINPVVIVQEENGVLRLEKLSKLIEMKKNDNMTEYIDKVAYYADTVMGIDWREGSMKNE
ncbi:MAG: CapA family protein [Eubacteriales bacterium]|nr:CapA family protein [Eubacteriales bacterium]